VLRRTAVLRGRLLHHPQLRLVRWAAANFQRSLPLPEHPDNGDEARYPSRFASYSKGLPHDSLGDVNTAGMWRALACTRKDCPAMLFPSHLPPGAGGAHVLSAAER
jgi:hypothetical protein